VQKIFVKKNAEESILRSIEVGGNDIIILAIKPDQLNIFNLISALVLHPVTEAGRKWCDAAVASGISEVSSGPVGTEGKTQFFVDVTLKDGRLHRWVFTASNVDVATMVSLQVERIFREHRPEFIFDQYPEVGLFLIGFGWG
jgi:hypothetical protein